MVKSPDANFEVEEEEFDLPRFCRPADQDMMDDTRSFFSFIKLLINSFQGKDKELLEHIEAKLGEQIDEIHDEHGTIASKHVEPKEEL